MPSILNGLSALGTGVAQFAGSAGLELQKQQLAQQSQILADQLATTRETKLQGQQQAFTAGENTQNRTATAINLAATTAAENARNAATIAGSASNNAATNAAAMARTQAEINAPTPTEKLFKFLKINPDGSPMTSGTAPSAATATPPATSASGDAMGSTSTPDPNAPSGAAPNASSAAPPPKPSVMDNPLVSKALGLPSAGSPEATRFAIAQDVAKEHPYWSVGQRATEVERLVGEASGLGRPRYNFAPAVIDDPDNPGQKISGVNRGNTKDGSIEFIRTDTDPNRAGVAGGLGNRAEVYFKRVTVAANEAAQAAQNIMEMPSSSTSGFFGQRGPPAHGLLGAAKESLTNALTTQEVQDYNTLVPGIGRSLAAIETGGLAPSGQISSSMDGLILKSGDSEMTKMRKMAELRQIVEKGMEPNLVDPKIPDVQKQQVKDIITQIQTAIPFTHHDITVLQQSKNPNVTMADVVKNRGIGGSIAAPASTASPPLPDGFRIVQ